MDSQKFCLKWDGFQGSVTSVFDVLRVDSELVDVTLCCEGRRVRAHRMMLSACSPYFRELFKDLPCQQLVIFLKDTSAADLTAIVEFMYKGSVNVAQSQLASFIKTAEMLQVQGLSGGDDKDAPPSPAPPPPRPPPEPPRAWSQPASPAGSLRRASDAASPAEPRHKRRRADIPPPPPVERRPSPPPGAGTVGAPHPPPLEEHAAQDATQPQFESAAVKVEKFDVDLTLDDEDEDSAAAGGDGSLEAALGSVAQYEGYDPGSDQSLSADGQMFGAGSDTMGGPYTPGTSQRSGGGGADDGSQDGRRRHTCPVCGAGYINRNHMVSHMRQHVGDTRCPVCGKEFTLKYNMRRHMVTAHRISQQEVNRMTKTRHSHQDALRAATAGATAESGLGAGLGAGVAAGSVAGVGDGAEAGARSVGGVGEAGGWHMVAADEHPTLPGAGWEQEAEGDDEEGDDTSAT